MWTSTSICQKLEPCVYLFEGDSVGQISKDFRIVIQLPAEPDDFRLVPCQEVTV